MLPLESNCRTVLPKRWSLQFLIRHAVYSCITSLEAKVKIRCKEKSNYIFQNVCECVC